MRRRRLDAVTPPDGHRQRLDIAGIAAASSAFVGALLGALPAHSAGSEDSGALEEVVVTAQKRSQNLQDVGISVQAFSASQLRDLNIQSSADIAAFTPGVALGGSTAGQQTLFTIRGVSQTDFNDIAESPNATYLDDGYLATTQAQSFALLDIERVEVLKGPQGTLFGRNATGGLIQYISKKPSLDRYEGYADFRLGVFDSPTSPMNEVLEAAFGGPISDTLAARIALKGTNQDSYLINRYPLDAVGGSPGPGSGANLGADSTFTGRLALLYKPSSDLSMLLSVNGTDSKLSSAPYEQIATIGQLDSAGRLINVYDAAATETRASISATGGDGGADVSNTGTFTPFQPRPVAGGDFFGFRPPGPWVTSSDFAFSRPDTVDSYGVDLHTDWTISESLSLTAVSDYKKYDKLLFVDVDSSPANLVANYTGDTAFSASQEVRLNGKTSNLDWVAGLYYLHIGSHAIAGLKFPGGSIVPGAPFDLGTDADLKTDSYSLFGQMDWQFAPQLGLVLGARAIREQKEYDFLQGIWGTTDSREAQVGVPLIIGPVIGAAGPEPYRNDSGETLWAGKVQLEFRPAEDLLFYLGVNRGVKAGSYNAQLAGGLPVPNSLIPYRPEVLVSTEGGFKSTFLDRRLRVNASVFHYDYHDYQGFLFTGVSGVVINRNAKTNGIEGTIEANPVVGLDVILGASYTHARVHGVPLLIGGSDIPVRDVEPTYSPPVQANLLLKYAHQAVGGGSLTERFSVVYSDRFYYNLRNFTADQFPHYFKLGLGADWTSMHEHWQVGLDVQNLTNKRIGSQGFDLAGLCGCNNVAYQPPRSYTVNLHYAY
ncbi:MAG TPA: TonB-dependent receptor [Steroidobacteraceae bacterium]|nr:TonB-dependent receptor [Steroidobacteraceae bacterium]